MTTQENTLTLALHAVRGEASNALFLKEHVAELQALVAANPWMVAFKKSLTSDACVTEHGVVVYTRGSCNITPFISVDLCVRFTLYEDFYSRQLAITIMHHPEGAPVAGTASVLMASQLPCEEFVFGGEQEVEEQLTQSLKHGVESILATVDKRSRLIQGYLPNTLSPRQYAELELVPEELMAAL